jgi:hypothetical protein
MWMLDSIGHWFQSSVHDSWRWVCTLNYQEWFLLLGIAAAAGFLCMRGMGSRQNF